MFNPTPDTDTDTAGEHTPAAIPAPDSQTDTVTAPGESGENTQRPRRARLEVDSFRTTLYVLNDDGRRPQRADVLWRRDETCVDAADRELARLGYERAGEWADGDGRIPSHLIGDRNGWYYATVTPLTATQP